MAIHGSKAAFKLDNSGGSLQTLTTYLDNISAPQFEVDTAEVTTLGSTYKSNITGLIGASISIEGPYDDTIDAHLAGLLGLEASSTFEYGPEGADTGDIKYSGECRLTSFSHESSVSDAGRFSAELIVTGTVTRGTFS